MSRHTHQVDVDNDGAVVGVVNLVPEISFVPPTAESKNHVNFDLCDLFGRFTPKMSLILQLWLPLLAISWSWVVTDIDDEADKYDYIRVLQQTHNDDATDGDCEAENNKYIRVVQQMHADDATDGDDEADKND